MVHTNQMKIQGTWLFRWRSFLPLALAPLFLIGLRHFTYPMGSHLFDRIWEVFCLAIALLGLGIRVYTVGHVPEGTSGRTTSKPKAQELNTTGMYSVVRNPIYLGNFIIWVGIVLLARAALLAGVCVLAFFIYYERIIVAEEEFLSEKFGLLFTQWAEKTPMIIPRLKLWRKPARPFLWQVALVREYPGVLTITAAFTAVEVLGDRFYEGKWQLDRMWAAILCAGLLLFVILWTLKKMRIIKRPANPPDQMDGLGTR